MTDMENEPTIEKVADRRRANLAKARAAKVQNRAAQRDSREEEIRPHHTPQGHRYDAQAELARAAEIARTIRENRSGLTNQIGEIFNISDDHVPPGFTYEGKRCSVGGKTEGVLGNDNIRQAHQGGWRPVPAKRHPELCAVGYSGDTIVKEGLMLMERPTTLVEEAKHIERMEARRAVDDKKAQLGKPTPGTLTDREDSRFQGRVSHSYRAPTPIPVE